MNTTATHPRAIPARVDPSPGPAGYAFIDTETTSLDPRDSRIIQLAVVTATPELDYFEQWDTLVDPGLRHIPAFHVHRITAADTHGQPDLGQIWERLSGLLTGRRLVGHNIAYDIAVLAAEQSRAGLTELPGVDDAVDTWLMSRRLMPGLANRRLGTVARALGVNAAGAHRAGTDAALCAVVFAGLRVMDIATPGGRAPGADAACKTAEQLGVHTRTGGARTTAAVVG